MTNTENKIEHAIYVGEHSYVTRRKNEYQIFSQQSQAGIPLRVGYLQLDDESLALEMVKRICREYDTRTQKYLEEKRKPHIRGKCVHETDGYRIRMEINTIYKIESIANPGETIAIISHQADHEGALDKAVEICNHLKEKGMEKL